LLFSVSRGAQAAPQARPPLLPSRAPQRTDCFIVVAIAG
jgi:hypothetical protein